MPTPRTVAWTLLAGSAFLAVTAASPAGQDKKVDRDKVPQKAGWYNEVSNWRNNPPVTEADVKKARATFNTFAEYYAAVIAHPKVYENAAEFNPDPTVPTIDGPNGIIAGLAAQIVTPEPPGRPEASSSTKIVPEHANYIREMGAALDAALKSVIETNPDRAVKINATRLLAVACRSGASAHWPTVTGLLTNANVPPDIKFYVYQAAGNLLAAYDITDLRVRRHAAGPKEVGALVAALESAVIQPSVLVAGPPGPDGKPAAVPADQLAAVRYVRRGAVRALGQVRFATVPGADGNPLFPAHTIARVAVGDAAVRPPPDPLECAEAVIGFCNMAPTKGYAADVAADVVATGVINFATPRAANPADKSIPWRGTAARLADALAGWRPLFDPNYDPSKPRTFETSLVPKPANDVVTEATQRVLGPLEQAGTAKIDVDGLKAFRRDLRKDPKAANTLYKDNPKLALPRKE